jgi:hypothetical protein
MVVENHHSSGACKTCPLEIRENRPGRPTSDVQKLNILPFSSWRNKHIQRILRKTGPQLSHWDGLGWGPKNMVFHSFTQQQLGFNHIDTNSLGGMGIHQEYEVQHKEVEFTCFHPANLVNSQR